MAKVIDITDKLSFDENPKICIKGQEFEVNADAETVLLMMGDFANRSEIEASLSAYEKMFGEKERERITKMKLPFKDLMTLIETAMNLVMGTEGEEEGEQ